MYTSLDQLTPYMQAALLRMSTDPVLIDGGPEKHKIRPVTLAALLRHHLIEQARDKRARPVWKPTTHGLKVIATEAPRLLAARSQHGYTTNPALALADEPEAVSDTWLDRFSKTAEQAQAAPPDTVAAWITERRELQNSLARFEGHTTDRSIHNEIQIIRQRIKAIDRELKAA